jgi:hypothetical protein
VTPARLFRLILFVGAFIILSWLLADAVASFPV